MDLEAEECVICRKPLGNSYVKVYSKGLQTLILCSEKRGDEEMRAIFERKNSVDVKVKLCLHADCRNEYTHPTSVKRALAVLQETARADLPDPSPKKLRSSASSFDWQRDCLFCGIIIN